MSSNLARLSLICMCLGPDASAVKNGRLMSVSGAPESSILAFSAASLSRCITSLSLETSMPVSFLKASSSQSMMTMSMSSPPRAVSPLVEMTSTTFSATSRIEMSKVPPPRS